MTLDDFNIGDRVEFLPHTDTFMRGIRYGTVTRITSLHLIVRGERLGKPAVVRTIPAHVARKSQPGAYPHSARAAAERRDMNSDEQRADRWERLK